METEIIHGQEEHKFYSTQDGKESYLTYNMTADDTINFNYTYVPPEQRGQGRAAALVEYGLNFARQKNFKVTASCGYVASVLRNNADYSDLLK
jgi:uncharacterized protein